ncbi:MAG: methyltransferase domain-containing protein [Candidatus Nanohaloarchaea archaeon]|nr:methyltransferase domain-containing protein [Candidatus Nanohaloarchaea archaeon]
MEYAVLLSEEHPEIPRAELEAVLEAEGIDFEVERQEGSLVLLEAGSMEGVAERLAMAFEISEVLHTFEPENYQKLAAKKVEAREPFAVRKVDVDGTEAPDEMEENVGRIIDKNSEVGVELETPGEVFRVYLAGGEAYLCRLESEVDRSGFESRQNQYRPYSSPVTIHPRLARALTNLSKVERGGTVLDPFCGTGGILLEAGLIGCKVYGGDVQGEMVEGARENLEAYGVEADVRQAEFSEVEDVFGDEEFDAVVSDLPYGKASKVEGDPAEEFVERAPELADRAVFMSDREDIDGLKPDFEIYVHRSMTRYVYVME